MPKKVGLVTDWVTLGTAGNTIDGRVIQDAWLEQAAAAYDCDEYTAVINSDHYLGYYGSFGQVRALRAAKDKKNRTVLQGRLEPNMRLLDLNSYGQKMFLSMEVDPDWCKSGKAYLVGLAVTDSPASLGTTELRFAAKKAKAGQYMAASVEVEPGVFAASAADDDSAEQAVLGLFKRVFGGQATGQAKEQAETMNDAKIDKLVAGQEKLTGQIGTLVQSLAKLAAGGGEAGGAAAGGAAAGETGSAKHGAQGGEAAGGEAGSGQAPGTSAGGQAGGGNAGNPAGQQDMAAQVQSLADGQTKLAAAVETLAATVTKALEDGKGKSFGKGTGAAGETSDRVL